jgi:ABC-type sugar transport system substrate-binding protein
MTYAHSVAARPRIALLLLTEEQEFQRLQAADAAAAAARAGLDLEVFYARNNTMVQVEQLYRLTHAPQGARPAAIIIHSVDGEGLPRVARDAVKAGIGWVVLNREVAYIESLRAEYPRLPIAIVTTDQPGIGRIQGKQIRELLPDGGGILYIQGPSDTSAARQRLQGMEEAIAGGKIAVQSLSGDWTEKSGEDAVSFWFRFSTSRDVQIGLVAAQNDAMAIGARKAIAAKRPDWLRVPFIGCDGLPEGGQRLVSSRELAATVIVQSNAGPAVDLIAAHLNGKSAPARVVLPPRPHPDVPLAARTRSVPAAVLK